MYNINLSTKLILTIKIIGMFIINKLHLCITQKIIMLWQNNTNKHTNGLFSQYLVLE